MSTPSTASSSTDGPGDGDPERGPDRPDAAGPASVPAAPASPAPAGYDAGRRRFFRSFGRQTFDAAAQVVGIAGAVQGATTNIAVNVVGLVADPDGAARRIATDAPPGAPAGSVAAAGGRPVPAAAGASDAPVAHRSPYRMDGDALILLDQRALPGALEEQIVRRGADVAYYARIHALAGGALLAQVAAYGIALTAKEVASRSYAARRAEHVRVTRAIAAARPSARMVRVAIARMSSVHDSFGPDDDPLAIAAALRREADRFAMDGQLDHATIARTVAARLPRPEDRPLGVLVHGAPGTSTGGHVGTALNALALVAQEERPLAVWVTEGRPQLTGARLATWELLAHGIDPVVVPDAAVGYLLDTQAVDVVLMGAEWIAADGSTGNTVGSRVVAEMAAAARRGPVPVWVTAPVETIDPGTDDPATIPAEVRHAREALTYVAGWRPARPNALVPTIDVVPAARIAAIVTEQGVHRADAAELAAALAARIARRPAAPPAWRDPVSGTATTADGPERAEAGAAPDDGPSAPDGPEDPAAATTRA